MDILYNFNMYQTVNLSPDVYFSCEFARYFSGYFDNHRVCTCKVYSLNVLACVWLTTIYTKLPFHRLSRFVVVVELLLPSSRTVGPANEIKIITNVTKLDRLYNTVHASKKKGQHRILFSSTCTCIALCHKLPSGAKTHLVLIQRYCARGSECMWASVCVGVYVSGAQKAPLLLWL